jgi:glycosyltransferase involved in cell wall biosynthesis
MHLGMVTAYPARGRSPAGGVESAVTRLVDALVSRGENVTVVAPAPGMPGRRWTQDGVSVESVPVPARAALLRLLRPWRSRAVEVLRGLETDVVHGHGLLVGGLVTADLGSIHSLTTAYGDAGMDTRAAYRGADRVARTLLRNALARRAVRGNAVIASAHPDWSVNLPLAPERFVHIPSIVDPCFADVRHDPEPGRVVYVGGPARIKGWDVLRGAWPSIRAQVPEATLGSFGWSDPGAAGGRDDASLGVEYGCRLEPRLLAETMSRAAVVVIPSRYDVAPLVLAEAWTVGVPVVATTAGGLARLGDGAAILVPSEDPVALGRAITQVLRGDHAAVSGVVAEGARRALACTPDAVATAHLELYRELAAARG